ncbi:neprilysin-2-like isoform X2 [Photinus pyralis]|nr:neprilysin-2-like isoform X2 [Photinus pyralis]
MVMRNQKIQNKVMQQLRAMIEEPTQSDESRPFVMLKKFYKACMDTDAIEKRGLTKMKMLLTELGGWPVLDGSSWNDTGFDWKEMVHQFRKIGFDNTGFLYVYISSDFMNSTRSIILIDEGMLMMKKDFLMQGFDSPVVRAFYNYIVKVAVAYGADPDLAETDMKDVINFQIEFARIRLSSEHRRNLTTLTNQMAISNLQRQFPTFPWVDYINGVLGDPNVAVGEADIVDVSVPSFIPKMEKLIARTSKRVQSNYLLLLFTQSVAKMQPEKIRNLQFELNKAVSGVQKVPPKWKDCVIAVNNRMGIATAALYVRKYFDEKSKNNIIDIIFDVKNAFIGSVTKLDWMDDDTQKMAVEKARKIVNHVAYPHELLNDTKIEEFYAKLEPADNLLDFHFNQRKFDKDFTVASLRNPMNKGDWTRYASSTAVNAFYRPSENSIELPAGILQDVYFDKDRPQYLNYGGIGFIIGHEITHGFDDQGRQIDKDGLLRDWWTKDTANTFISKSKCIIEQYSNFTVPNSNVSMNGINTQGENIADNGGVKMAYLAYRSWVQRNGEEASLPGLKYTPYQLFWISVANIWCAKARPEILDKLAVTAHHSLPNFRVTGPMRNSQHFAEDFNCPLTSNMNPEDKCSIW